MVGWATLLPQAQAPYALWRGFVARVADPHLAPPSTFVNACWRGLFSAVRSGDLSALQVAWGLANVAHLDWNDRRARGLMALALQRLFDPSRRTTASVYAVLYLVDAWVPVPLTAWLALLRTPPSQLFDRLLEQAAWRTTPAQRAALLATAACMSNVDSVEHDRPLTRMANALLPLGLPLILPVAQDRDGAHDRHATVDMLAEVLGCDRFEIYRLLNFSFPFDDDRRFSDPTAVAVARVWALRETVGGKTEEDRDRDRAAFAASAMAGGWEDAALVPRARL